MLVCLGSVDVGARLQTSEASLHPRTSSGRSDRLVAAYDLRRISSSLWRRRDIADGLARRSRRDLEAENRVITRDSEQRSDNAHELKHHVDQFLDDWRQRSRNRFKNREWSRASIMDSDYGLVIARVLDRIAASTIWGICKRVAWPLKRSQMEVGRTGQVEQGERKNS